jgi:PAS domain S-box-containing protein
MASNGAERHVEFSLVRQVDRVKLALVLLSAVVVLEGGNSIVIHRQLAGFVLVMSSLLTVWSYFVLRWDEIAADGKLPIFVTAFVIVDLGLAASFVEATGGFHSPFWPILLLPVIFASIFFSGARLALPLTAALVGVVISMQAEPERAWGATQSWELLSRLGIIALVAWVAWALTAVLERERLVNQTIVRHLTEGALLVGPDNSVLLANPALARMCGLPVHEMIGRRMSSLVGGASDLLAQIVQDAVERPASTMTRDLALQPGRLQSDLRCITVPCADEDGQPIAWLVIVQDLTEIRALTRMKERSIGMLSHELRSPLTSMRGLARVLTGVTGTLSTAEQRQALAFLEKESDRLSRLVTDMLDVAGLEQSQIALDARHMRVEASLERVVNMFAAQAAEKEVSLRYHITGHLPPVLADPDRVSQILVALVDNALKHTPAGGKITVRAATRGGRAEIRVKDTGCGIPPEALTLIFEKFGQAVPEADYVLEQRGLGLGLYVAQLLARKLGGDLTVRSELGEGSTFTLSLPLANPLPDSAPQLAALPALSAS